MNLNNQVVIKDEDNRIFVIETVKELGAQKLCLCFEGGQVATRDYINPDMHDIQGYVKAEDEWFSISVYVTDGESLNERLKEDGYTILEKLPKIYEQFSEETLTVVELF